MRKDQNTIIICLNNTIYSVSRNSTIGGKVYYFKLLGNSSNLYFIKEIDIWGYYKAEWMMRKTKLKLCLKNDQIIFVRRN